MTGNDFVTDEHGFIRIPIVAIDHHKFDDMCIVLDGDPPADRPPSIELELKHTDATAKYAKAQTRVHVPEQLVTFHLQDGNTLKLFVQWTGYATCDEPESLLLLTGMVIRRSSELQELVTLH